MTLSVTHTFVSPIVDNNNPNQVGPDEWNDTHTANFTAAGTGATQRTLDSKLKDFVSVKDFGATGNGVTDDLTAFNNALAAATNVYVPAGTYIVSGTISITQNSTRLIGAGRATTTITATGNNSSAISVTASLSSVEISDLLISRTGSPTTNAHGLIVNEGTAHVKIHNITVANQGGWGVVLAPTAYGSLTNSIVQQNTAGGVLVTGTATSGSLQWEIHNCVAGQNAGVGFNIQAASGPSQATLGSYTNLITYANTGHGIAFIGLSSVPMYGVRLFDSLFGSDAASEVYLDTYGRGHIISNVSTELAGVSATGPTLSTAASNVGYGFEFTANNTEIELLNSKADNHSLDGLRSSASYVGATGNVFTNCGHAAVGGFQSGANFDAGTAIRVIGNKLGNISGGTSVTFGLVAGSSVVDFIATNNDLTSSGTPLTSNATGTQFLAGNFGATQNNQFIISLAANTSVDGWSLIDPTAATSGNQRYSPRLRLTGRGWKTNATAASQTVDWIIENQPVQGAANPQTDLVFSSQVNSGGYVQKLRVTNDPGNTTLCSLKVGGSNDGSAQLTINPGGTDYAFIYTDTTQILWGSNQNIPSRFYSNAVVRWSVPAAGGLVVGDSANALATNATDGFLYIPTCAGTPTGTPTAQTGTVPMVYDTTNNKLYIRNGGAWKGGTAPGAWT